MQPILFLHGFMGSSLDFQGVISYLSGCFYCLAIDLPGHGETKIIGKDECYCMENTAQALINLLDVLNFSSCFLVGYSMGGRLALYLALHHRHRFPKVVLESASPGLKTHAERQQRIQKDLILAQQLERENFYSFLLNWYHLPLFSSLTKHPQFQSLVAKRLKNNPIMLAKSLRFLGTGCQPSLWEKLETNCQPLCLLVGELDLKFRKINSQMAALCPTSELIVISQCGHNIHFENAQKFADAVRQFFSR